MHGHLWRPLFDHHAVVLAVPEPITAGTTLLNGLTVHERAFYHRLLGLPKGSVEQEFLPKETVTQVLSSWH